MYEADRFLQSKFAEEFLGVWHKAWSRQSPVLLAVAFLRLVCQLNHSRLFCRAQLAICRIHRNIEFPGDIFGSDWFSRFVGNSLDQPPRGLCYTGAEMKAFNEHLIKDQSRDCKVCKIDFHVAIAIVVISLERPN